MIKPKKKFKSGRSFKGILLRVVVIALILVGVGIAGTDLFVRSFNLGADHGVSFFCGFIILVIRRCFIVIRL